MALLPGVPALLARKKHRCLRPVLLCLLVAGPTLAAQQAERDLDQLVAAGNEAAAHGDYAGAAAAYKDATTRDDSIPELWANRGLMEHLEGKPADSAASFEHALKLKPSLFTPNLFLGVDLVELNQPERALPYLKAAEKLKPSDPQAPINLGKAHSALKEYPAAARAYARAAELDGKSAPAWFGLGVAALAQVDADGRTLSATAGDSAWAKALYADSLVEQGRLHEAASIYETLLARPDGGASAIAASAKIDAPPCSHAALGFIYLRQGLPAQAGTAFAVDAPRADCPTALLGQALLAIESGDDPTALRTLGTLAARDRGFVAASLPPAEHLLPPEALNRFFAAVAQARTAGSLPEDLSAVLTSDSPKAASEITDAPHSALVSKTRAHAAQTPSQLLQAGHFSACEERLKTGLHPAQLLPSLELARCSFLAGDFAAAAQASATALSRDPQSQPALYWSVRANERRAVEALTRFEEVAPDSPATHVLVGDLLRHRQKLDAAVEEYKKALAAAPDDPAALLGLAASYLLDSRNDEAVEIAKQGLVQSPGDPRLNLLIAEAMAAQHHYAAAEPYLLPALQGPPEMQPRVHALLGRAYAEQGRTADAIAQLKLGLPSDDDGSIHYQLARLYQRDGNAAASTQAMMEAKAIEAERRQRAVVAVQDASPQPTLQ